MAYLYLLALAGVPFALFFLSRQIDAVVAALPEGARRQVAWQAWD